ncbi:MAG: thioredoxin family protein [Cyclobacteriaceae bacterium]
MKSLISVALISFLATTQWLTDFNAAQQEAQKDHKFILISFSGSDWCGPCIKMKQEVYGSSEFESLAEKKLVLVRADFPRSKKNQLPKEQVKLNEALAEKYNPSGKFPFTVLTDENGKVVKTWDGYAFGSQDTFMKELTEAVSH